MMIRILVINPNSNHDFTEQLDQAVDTLRIDGAIEIECTTLEGTPYGIESQRDVDSVIDPVCEMVARNEDEFDSFVIACFADTGVQSAREVTSKPVVGICEAGISTALNVGELYGIISTADEAKNAGLRQVRSLGLEKRMAGDEAVNIPVAEMLTSNQTCERVIEAGTLLKAAGAEVLVLGCAGMTPYRKQLEETVGLPVVDPTIAATAMVIGLNA